MDSFATMTRALPVARRTIKAFSEDQMSHHAAALTYYALMSLFPGLLLGLSLLGLLGQYPETYDEILAFLRGIVPEPLLSTIDASLRSALRSKGTAATALAVGVLTTLYGTTGLLEAARRALNVVFETEERRGFVRRKGTDIASTFVLMALILVTLILMFVGGRLAAAVFGLLGLGSTAVVVWNIVRWPLGAAAAMLVFAWVYYVTPNVQHRAFKWITPGAVVGVIVWLGASAAFFFYVSNFGSINATYGTFAAAVILLVWLWLTNAALLFGAELNAEMEREKELREGVPAPETLQMPEKA